MDRRTGKDRRRQQYEAPITERPQQAVKPYTALLEAIHRLDVNVARQAEAIEQLMQQVAGFAELERRVTRAEIFHGRILGGVAVLMAVITTIAAVLGFR